MTDLNRRGPHASLHSKQLGQLLIESNDIQTEQLAKALQIQEQQGGLLGTVLLQMGACSIQARRFLAIGARSREPWQCRGRQGASC